MTSCYLSSSTCIRLFAHAIRVGAYWRGFRNPATSKMEHFVAIAKTFPKKKKKTVKRSAKKEKENCGR